MKERPIIFSGDMVKAILEDRKTQTRRIIKPQPIRLPAAYDRVGMTIWPPGSQPGEDGVSWGDKAPSNSPTKVMAKHCPYGQTGDRLWVREAWCEHWIHNGEEWIEAGYRYKATDEKDKRAKWYPSIYMPHCASRIALEIVSIRVEKLQEISEEDYIKEGLKPCKKNPKLAISHYSEANANKLILQKDFMFLWDSINGEVNPWSSNPWVWVIEFRRVK